MTTIKWYYTSKIEIFNLLAFTLAHDVYPIIPESVIKWYGIHTCSIINDMYQIILNIIADELKIVYDSPRYIREMSDGIDKVTILYYNSEIHITYRNPSGYNITIIIAYDKVKMMISPWWTGNTDTDIINLFDCDFENKLRNRIKHMNWVK